MEAIYTIVWILAFITIVSYVVNLVSKSIGDKVHEYHMKEEIKARDLTYAASFDDFMRHINNLGPKEFPEAVATWIPRQQYEEYLYSDQWKEKALHRMDIDNHTCQYCHSEVRSRNGIKHSPNVHHLHYRTLMNENVMTDLVTLCKHCHTSLHKTFSLPEMEIEIDFIRHQPKK